MATPDISVPDSATHSARVRRWWWRAWDMACVWGTFGIAVGILTAPSPRNVIVVAAGIIAGGIVLTPIGAVLGLFGARHSESLAGGFVGLLIGMGAGVTAWVTNPAVAASSGLIMGGMAGATLLGLFWRLPRFLTEVTQL